MGTYKSKFYPFSETPSSDSCWSLSTGPDGRIYAAACVELTGGGTVTVVRYNEETDSLEYLFEADKVTGDLRDSGRATQCKVHYSFVPSPSDGILYAATHLSGPPKGETSYCPWNSWHDSKRAFAGSFLMAYDTVKDRVAWSTLMIPREGCRCLCLDDKRQRLYAITYPRDHFVMFDLRTRKLKDLGRIGSVNTQCLFMDGKGFVYFFDDLGRLTRFDPERECLEILPHVMPHMSFQTGWHGVIYDAVSDHSAGAVYMVPWMVKPRLLRFWPDDGPFGRVEDLGPVLQETDLTFPTGMWLEHVGGLVMGMDDKLYFVKPIWPEGEEIDPDVVETNLTGVLVRMDPETLERKDVCVFKRQNTSSHYISRGARDHAGNLYFGTCVSSKPVGLFRVTVPDAGTGADLHLPLRMWG